MAPRKRHDLGRGLTRGVALAAFLLSAGMARSEPLLTRVPYAEGDATYALFDATGQPLARGGPSSSRLRSGMTLPAATRVETAGDARVLLSPSPQIKYLLFPGSRVINKSLAFHAGDVRDALDYRIEVVYGNLVGDIQGPLHNTRNQVETPQGTASTDGGHFLIAVDAKGNVKYAVLAGTLTVKILSHGVYVLGPMQILNVLSGSEAKRIADGDAAAAASARAVGPLEPQTPSAVPDQSLEIKPLDRDDIAYLYLTTPFPTPNADQFAGASTLPASLLPGQQDALDDPANFFTPNPANTENNPPISPILP